MKKGLKMLFVLTVSTILLVGCSPSKEDLLKEKTIKDNNVTFYMNIDNISYVEDVKTNDTDTKVQGTITKGEVNVGDTVKLKTLKEDFEAKVAFIRIDEGNKELQTAKVGQEVQMVLDNYHGTNKALFLYNNK